MGRRMNADQIARITDDISRLVGVVSSVRIAAEARTDLTRTATALTADEIALIEAVEIAAARITAEARADLTRTATEAARFGHDPFLAVRGRADVLAAPMRHP